MAGTPGKSGRNKEPGRVFQFFFYYRLLPGEDPPELESLLESIIQAKGRKRRDILRAALLGGARQAQTTAETVEDSADISLFDDMFASF